MNRGVAGSAESGRGTVKQTEGNRDEEESTESPRDTVKEAEMNRGKEESTETNRGGVHHHSAVESGEQGDADREWQGGPGGRALPRSSGLAIIISSQSVLQGSSCG